MAVETQPDESVLELVAETPQKPREQQIRELFEETGPVSTRVLVNACIERGVFTDADVLNAHIRAFQGIVRDALSRVGKDGLPPAGPSSERDADGAPLWKQRSLWTFEDYEANVQDIIAHRNAGHAQALRLVAECKRRFRRSIELPQLPRLLRPKRHRTPSS